MTTDANVTGTIYSLLLKVSSALSVLLLKVETCSVELLVAVRVMAVADTGFLVVVVFGRTVVFLRNIAICIISVGMA
jgi:hypothetical protein